jgi:ribulose bisphosphate carboxylase small subunit
VENTEGEHHARDTPQSRRTTRTRGQGHRTAAEHNEKGENETGNWHSQRAMEYSDHAYKLAKEAHAKSGQIVTL